MIVALLFALHASAAPLTLDQAIDLAERKSPELAGTRAQAETAQWRVTESLGGFLPTLGVTGHYFFHERFPVIDAQFGTYHITQAPVLGDEKDAEFALKVPLFDGFRNIDAYEASRNAARAADLDSEFASFQLRENVRLAFYSVLAAQELEKAADQNVVDLREHRRLVSDQVRAGVATRVAALRIDTQISNALDDSLNARNEVVIRKQQLAQLLGQDEIAAPLEGGLEAPSEGMLEKLDRGVPQRRADIEAIDLRTEAAVGQHRSQSKWWLPSVSFVGNYDIIRADQLRLNYFALGLQANWMLFDLASHAKAKEALASERVSDSQHEASVLKARTDVEVWRRRYEYNLRRYRTSLEDLKRSTESVHLARSALKVGAQTTTDVLDAEQDLFNTRAKKIRAQYDALEALVRFELATGRTVAP